MKYAKPFSFYFLDDMEKKVKLKNKKKSSKKKLKIFLLASNLKCI